MGRRKVCGSNNTVVLPGGVNFSNEWRCFVIFHGSNNIVKDHASDKQCVITKSRSSLLKEIEGKPIEEYKTRLVRNDRVKIFDIGSNCVLRPDTEKSVNLSDVD